ncbi:MAG TPA: TonB-dependent receptor [Steroidobacteraceae bacterium]|nr:TonB-dependent receptor [Steroidobacteraceae bacterium]
MSTTASSDLKILACSLLGLAAAATVPAVGATTDTTTDGDQLTEVVVTANKLNAASVITVPASIQAISGDALERDDASGIMSIAGQIPGLSIQDLGPGDKKYVIRGINSTGDSTVGVYYGEAVVTQGNGDDGGGFQPDIRLYDIDRVEVLRGPQGTLYGASSMSGTIRYIPKEPIMDAFDGYLSLEDSQTQHAGNNYNANGALNLPIVNGVLALRVVGWRLYDSGYVNQIRVGSGVTAVINGQTLPVQGVGFVKGVNDDDVGGGRAILRYQPTDDLLVDFDYTAQQETSDGSSRWTPPGVAAFSGGPIAPVDGCDLCNTDVTRSPWSDNLKVFGATLKWHTNLGELTATSHQFNRDTGFTFDSTPILVSFGVPIPAETLEPRERRSNSSELRFATSLNLPINFVVGAFRQQTTQDLAVDVITTDALGYVTGPFSSANSADALNFPGVGDTFFGRTDHRGDDQWAGFGEATWKLTDRLTAVGGVRYFSESLEGFQVQTHPFGGFPPGSPTLVPLFDPHETFNKVTWKGNLSYRLSDAALLYTTVATGFRSGGLNAVSEPFEPIPAAYAPDTLTNYEAGIKGRLANGLFEYQLDGYLIHWDNMQIQLTTADGAFVYQGNAGTAEVKGTEFELRARPIQYLTGTITGSYQHAVLTQGASALQKALNPTLGVTGDKIPNVPDFQFSLELDYTQPVAANWAASAGTDVTYRGSVNSYFASNPFNLPLQSYTLWNLRAGAIYGDWTFMAFIHNAANERAQVSAINSSQDPHALLTVQPRTIGLNVTRKF